MLSARKKEDFWIGKKRDTIKNVLLALSFSFSFFQPQNIHFFTFGHIEKLA